MVAGRPSRCFTVAAAFAARAEWASAGHGIGVGHETIGFDRARFGLALLAAIAASAMTARRPRAAPGPSASRSSISASRVRWCARPCGSGIRIPRRTSISSGSRQPAPTRASPPTARSTARASWSGGCAARRATTRRPSTASMPARCATAGRTARAVSRSAPARCSRAAGSNGLLDGKGVHIDADGNRYEGMFAAGVPNGEGRLLARTGEIFDGEFRDGLRHGKGKTRLAGGTVYESRVGQGQGDRRRRGPTRSPTPRSAACSRRSPAAATPTRSRSASSSTSA